MPAPKVKALALIVTVSVPPRPPTKLVNAGLIEAVIEPLLAAPLIVVWAVMVLVFCSVTAPAPVRVILVRAVSPARLSVTAAVLLTVRLVAVATARLIVAVSALPLSVTVTALAVASVTVMAPSLAKLVVSLPRPRASGAATPLITVYALAKRC